MTHACEEAAGPAVDGADASLGDEGPWDRGWAVLDRWAPPVLLGISTLASIFSPDGPSDGLPGTLALAGFAAVWVTVGHTAASRARREHPAHVLVYLVGALTLAAALMSRDVVFFVFAIVGFLHAGALRPPPLVFVGVGTTSFLILYFTWGGLPASYGERLMFATILVVQTLLISYGFVAGEKLTELSEGRRHTVRKLEETLAENEGLHAQLVAQARDAGVQDERQRMAREIHDTVAQGLTGVVTQLEAAAQGIDDPAVLRRHLDNASALARTSLAEARRSVQALMPGALERGRLEDALEELGRDWTRMTGITVTTTVTGATSARSAAVEVALLRVAQEALANVAKHAGASRVGVTLSPLDDALVLDVRDDGRGFDPAAVDATSSFGLATMRQRVAALGGTFVVESDRSGTAISVTVPQDGAMA